MAAGGEALTEPAGRRDDTVAARVDREEWRLPAVCDRRPFVDVAVRHTLCAEIVWAAEAGVVTGRCDGTFRPDVAVERQETAAVLARLERR